MSDDDRNYLVAIVGIIVIFALLIVGFAYIEERITCSRLRYIYPTQEFAQKPIICRVHVDDRWIMASQFAWELPKQ